MNFSLQRIKIYWIELNWIELCPKTTGIYLILLNLTQKQYQDGQLELFQYYIKIHPDHLESVWENEARGFALCWPCEPQPSSRSLKVV